MLLGIGWALHGYEAIGTIVVGFVIANGPVFA